MEDTGSSDLSDSEPDSLRPSAQERKLEKAGSGSTPKQQSLHSDVNSSTRTSFPTSEDDISIFKRVLQQIPDNPIFDTSADFAQSQKQNVTSSAPDGVNGTRTAATQDSLPSTQAPSTTALGPSAVPATTANTTTLKGAVQQTKVCRKWLFHR
jgi:hypothetical protein